MKKLGVSLGAALLLAGGCGGNDSTCEAGKALDALDAVICGIHKEPPSEPERVELDAPAASRTFVAAPDGAGSACDEVAPCSLQAAKAKVAAFGRWAWARRGGRALGWRVPARRSTAFFRGRLGQPRPSRALARARGRKARVERQQVCARVENLAPGRHTLRVRKKGGQYLALDALQVRDAPERRQQ